MTYQMVEIFKTSVTSRWEANAIVGQLQQQLPGAKINFDLEDCDKILRIEYENVPVRKVQLTLQKSGYYCRLLD